MRDENKPTGEDEKNGAVRPTGQNGIPGEAAGNETPSPEETPGKPTERLRYILWVDLLAILGVLVVANILGGILRAFIEKSAGALPGFATFVAYVAMMGITLAFAVWLRIRHGEKGPILRFNLRKTNPSLILWGIILVVITSVVVEPLINVFPAEYMERLNVSVGRGGWAMLTTIVMAPILEELLFRGVIQGTVTREYGGVRGVLVASAMFGLIHIIPQQVITAFFIGIILGYIYIKTRSLLPVILIHAINNALAYIQMTLLGDEYIHTREIIGNDTVYWIVYGACVLIFIVAGFNLWSQIGKEQGRMQSSASAYDE